MKTKTYFGILILAITLLTTGCGPLFGNVDQYRKGDWYGVADEKQVARMEQDKLALEKLKGQPVMTASAEAKGSTATLGYKGIVSNRSRSYTYTFTVYGPETKSWTLEPGGKVEDFLIPGSYHGIITRGGEKVGWHDFKSGPQINQYNNQPFHWVFYADR